MHSPSLLVLSTLAIGQAAAGTIRHAGFHARRHAEAKRDDGLLKTDWGNVQKSVDHYVDYDAAIKAANVDLKTVSVDWNTVNYAAETPAPAASTPAPAAPKAEAKVEAPKAESKPESSSADASSASKPAASSPAPVVETKQKSSSLGEFVDGLIDDIESWTDAVSNAGVNSKTKDQPVWLGDDGKWVTTFRNKADKDIMIVCWLDTFGQENNMGFVMKNVANKPIIKVKIPQGKAQKVSFEPINGASKVSGACAPAYKDMPASNSGGLKETWYEWTFGPSFPTYDVSRLPSMSGMTMSATSSSTGCVSDMEQCVYKCRNGKDFCMEYNDVNFIGVGTNGCHGQGNNGGCKVGEDGDNVEVVLS